MIERWVTHRPLHVRRICGCVARVFDPREGGTWNYWEIIGGVKAPQQGVREPFRLMVCWGWRRLGEP